MREHRNVPRSRINARQCVGSCEHDASTTACANKDNQAQVRLTALLRSTIIVLRCAQMDCCAHEQTPPTRERRRVLQTVLAINLVLFVVEMSAGWLASSTALLGDSLDMLGDSLVYAFSLYVVSRSQRARAQAALLKGFVMLFFGILVFGEAAAKVMSNAVPVAATMGAVGLLALAGNAACFGMLYRHRSSDINMRSTWLCSRNDLIANVAVLVAAALVAYNGASWPDIAVGVAIGTLFLQTAWGVLRDATKELQAPSLPPQRSDSAAQPNHGESYEGALPRQRPSG